LESNNPFAKYGLTPENGGFRGPTRPPRVWQTPWLYCMTPDETLPVSYRDTLRRWMTEPFSAFTEAETLAYVLDRIFWSLTRGDLASYVHVRFFTRDDFAAFRSLQPTVGEFNTMNCQGLLVIEDTGGAAVIPPSFHGIGHALYPESDDRYIDELRAYYFELKATRRFEMVMAELGLRFAYPRERGSFPSPDHAVAYAHAQLLVNWEVTDDPDEVSPLRFEVYDRLLTHVHGDRLPPLVPGY
jgi:hypothetical protein